MNRSVAVLGLGASGYNVARVLAESLGIKVGIYDPDPARRSQGLAIPGVTECSSDGSGFAVVVLATPAGDQGLIGSRLLQGGRHVVSMSDRPSDVVGLLDLSTRASEKGLSVVVGAGMAPGLSCLLARHAGDALDRVEEISVSKTGTGGPACARQHHRALKRAGRDLVEGQWILRRGGSGRDLAWFPQPIGARDCYRGALASPLLLHRVYPGVNRISARMSATRRDRLTFRLPMLRPPHADGGPGAVRVEVRGLLNGSFETLVYGVVADPSLAAGLTAAAAAEAVLDGRIGPGAQGLAELDRPVNLLMVLREQGLRVETIGKPIPLKPPNNHIGLDSY